MATRAQARALQQREDAHRRRDEARRRAGERLLPMWRARRACYDSRGPVVAMWSGDRAPGTDGHGPHPEESPAYPWTDLAEGIVNRLFAISLVITSARSTLRGPQAEQLDQAVDMLDRLIRDVRRSVWRDMTSETWNLPPRPGAGPGAETPPAARDTPGPA